MDKFAKELSFYSAYHQEHTNVWIHVFGVPLISFTAFVPASWLQLFEVGGLPITAATVFYFGTILYYFTLDRLFASIAALLYGALLIAAYQVSSLGYGIGSAVFVTGQVIGWSAQIYGHLHFERNRPAFLENVFQSFVSAPLFIIADVCFHLGLKKDLQARVTQVLADTGRLRVDVQASSSSA